MAHNSVDFTCCGAPNPEFGPLLGVRCPSPRPAPRERGISNSSRKRGAENAYVGRSPSISLSIRLMHTTCERAGKPAKNDLSVKPSGDIFPLLLKNNSSQKIIIPMHKSHKVLMKIHKLWLGYEEFYFTFIEPFRIVLTLYIIYLYGN